MVIRGVAGRAESGGPVLLRGTHFQPLYIRISSLKHIFSRFFELSLIDSRAGSTQFESTRFARKIGVLGALDRCQKGHFSVFKFSPSQYHVELNSNLPKNPIEFTRLNWIVREITPDLRWLNSVF